MTVKWAKHAVCPPGSDSLGCLSVLPRTKLCPLQWAPLESPQHLTVLGALPRSGSTESERWLPHPWALLDGAAVCDNAANCVTPEVLAGSRSESPTDVPLSVLP